MSRNSKAGYSALTAALTQVHTHARTRTHIRVQTYYEDSRILVRSEDTLTHTHTHTHAHAHMQKHTQ